MSFPVPLSPWIRTGTFAPASFVRRSRTEFIASVRPKTMASGGISPRGWTSVFTPLLVMGLSAYQVGGRNLNVASGAPKSRRPHGNTSNLDYLIEDDQLTKEP